MARFRFEETDRYLRILLPTDPQPRDHEEFKIYLKKWSSPQKEIMIFDAGSLPTLPTWFLRDLTQLQQKLKGQPVKIHLVNLSKEGMKQIEQGGVGQLLAVRRTLDELLVELGFKQRQTEAAGPASGIDPEWITIFDRALHFTFESNLPEGSEFSIPKAESRDDLFSGDLFSTFCFHTEEFAGELVLAFQKGALLRFRSLFVGEEFTQLDADSTIAASEFLQLVFQQMQRAAIAQGKDAPQRKTNPRVLKGTYAPLNPEKASGCVIDLLSPSGAIRAVFRQLR